MNLFMLGAISALSVVAAVYFVRFWRDTGDRLFLAFGAAFGLEGINRLALAASPNPSEGQPLYYLVRLLAFLLILAAVIDRNRRRS